MWPLGLILFFAMAAARPVAIPFEHATAEERAAEGERVRSMRSASPAIELQRKGSRAVIVTMLGEKRTGGYAIEIRRLVRRQSTLQVIVEVKEPPKGAFVTQAFTYPFDVVWIRVSALGNTRKPPALELVDQNGQVLARSGPGQPR